MIPHISLPNLSHDPSHPLKHKQQSDEMIPLHEVCFMGEMTGEIWERNVRDF